MKSILFLLSVIFSSVTYSAVLITSPQLEMVQELNHGEPFEALLHQDGYLYIGGSRNGIYSDYKLNIYNADLKLVSTFIPTHALRHLYPYGKNQVMALGINPTKQLSEYSIITEKNGKFTSKTTSISQNAWASEFTINSNSLLFTDIAGKLEEVNTPEEAARPAMTLFQIGTFGPRFLSLRVRLPTRPQMIGGNLYLVESQNIGNRFSNILEINLKTNNIKRYFAKNKTSLSNLKAIQNETVLAAPDTLSNEVHLVNRLSYQTIETIKVESPIALGEYGKCLVVGSYTKKQLSFFKFTESKSELAALWDISAIGEKFQSIRNLQADSKKGRIFLRSNTPCNSMVEQCPETHNAVIAAIDKDLETIKLCR